MCIAKEHELDVVFISTVHYSSEESQNPFKLLSEVTVSRCFKIDNRPNTFQIKSNLVKTKFLM